MRTRKEFERAAVAWWQGEAKDLRRELIKRLRRGHLLPAGTFEQDIQIGRFIVSVIGAAFHAGWLARERMQVAEGQAQALFKKQDH